MSNNSIYIIILYLNLTLFGLESINAQKIPKGHVENFLFTKSTIFPGTERKVSVYIPSQINTNKSACVYVQQDGLDLKDSFQNILDSLIAKKVIPVMVGIFITPGNLIPDNKNNVPRPNRGFEYDGVGDNYVRFLLEEILPFVAKKFNLNLSSSGNDRAIGGASSGGISAFNTAWERPDAFSRVYCNSGSFVAFRGGNEFPILIRKTEPKPIRTFLTVGTSDMENCAGDWTLLNMEMDKALKFSGYDYKFQILEGGHTVGYKKYFSEAMRFLWKDWPKPINRGKGAPRVQDIILPDQPWQIVSSGYNDSRGPACNSKGEVFFTDPRNNKIFKIGLDGQVTTYVKNSGNCNSLSIGPLGDLFSTSVISGKIMHYDSLGKSNLLAEGIYGQYILARPNGGFYVSTVPINNEPGKLWLVEKGKKATVVDWGLKNATGIAITPDQWLLAVADEQSHWVYSYEMTVGGKLINKERFFWLYTKDGDDNSGAESMCYDKEGHLYVATKSGIQVCTWDGPTQIIMPVPNGKVKGICLGGEDLDILFAFCGDKIYKRKIKTHAIGAFTPWMIMPKGKH